MLVGFLAVARVGAFTALPGNAVTHGNHRAAIIATAEKGDAKKGSDEEKSKAPQDEERWGDEPVATTTKASTSMNLSANPALIGGAAAIAAAAAYIFTQNPISAAAFVQ